MPGVLRRSVVAAAIPVIMVKRNHVNPGPGAVYPGTGSVFRSIVSNNYLGVFLCCCNDRGQKGLEVVKPVPGNNYYADSCQRMNIFTIMLKTKVAEDKKMCFLYFLVFLMEVTKNTI